VKFEILPFHKLQEFEDHCQEKHIIIRYISPGIEYPNITISQQCIGIAVINCHDIERPMTPFNAQVIKDYPDFYKKPYVYFNKHMAEYILDFVYFNKNQNNVDLVVCQCHAGISRSSATAAALSKIFNKDDMWVFNNNCNWVPNNLIYRTILEQDYLEMNQND
jgi:predicted protein tyrosine phosphatase